MERREEIETLLARGIELQRNNQLVEAEAIYHQVLAIEPEHPDAIHLLGMMAYQIGDDDLAIELIGAAVHLNPDVPVFHNNLGNVYWRMGRLGEAGNAFRRATELDPRNPEALYNLARLMVEEGDAAGAVAAYRQLLLVAPKFPEAHNNLAGLLREEGDLDEAVSHYRRALEIAPDYEVARENLSACLVEKGKPFFAAKDFDRALEYYLKAIDAHPDGYNAYFQSGLVYQEKKEFIEAVKYYSTALRLQPDLGEVYFNLGLALRKSGRPKEALDAFNKAVELKDHIYQAHIQIGVALRQENRLHEAEAALRRSIAVYSGSFEAWNMLGITLNDLGRYEEGVEALERAIELSPDTAQCHNNLAMAYSALGKFGLSISAYDKALICLDRLREARESGVDVPLSEEVEADENPEFLYANIHFNRAIDYLASGRLEEGWREYEWRWPAKPSVPRRYVANPYNGDPLAGRTLLLWGEQGLGDELLFANMIPDAVKGAGHVLIECEARLVPLFSRSFPGAEVVGRSNPPNPRLLQGDIDFQAPFGSLGQWFRKSLDAFPRTAGYIKGDDDKRRMWRERLAALGAGRKIGLCWRSGVITHDRQLYYSRLEEDWGEVFSCPGSTFVNLQYDRCDEEVARAEEKYGVTIHKWSDLDLRNDLDGVAALMSELDLVISPSTAVAAMAGALGVRCWQMSLSTTWTVLGVDDGTTPWYPAMRFFLRHHGDEWKDVLGRIAGELRSL